MTCMLIQSFELVVYMLRPGALKQRNSHLKNFLIQTKNFLYPPLFPSQKKHLNEKIFCVHLKEPIGT